jgi:hypothetical protein
MGANEDVMATIPSEQAAEAARAGSSRKSRMRKVMLALGVALLAAAVILAAGCGAGSGQSQKPVPSPPPSASDSGPATAIPAAQIQFQLFPPDSRWKEKRSGLYAVWDDPRGNPIPNPGLFAHLADRGQQPVTASGGDWLFLVGKLPGQVTEKDFFRSEAGAMDGGKITMPARYVQYAGPITARLGLRDVYVVAHVKGKWPPGKYRATISFTDHTYTGDPEKTEPVPAGQPSHFAPLVCEFEVRAAAGGDPGASR